MTSRILVFVAVLALAPAAYAAPPPALQDLAGTWVAGKALQTILAKRSPHAAVAESVKITATTRKSGRLDWNNTHEGSWRTVVGVEAGAVPDQAVLVTGAWEILAPKPAEQVRVPIRVQRNAAGKVEGLTFLSDVLVQAQNEPWTRLEEPVATYLNKKVLAGAYRDDRGRAWTFTPDGKAVWPNASFGYEVSIDDSEADCDYIAHPQKDEVGGYKRYGFLWRKGHLRLFSITYPKDGAAPIHCDKLLADLSPK